jgi:BspA type Leucine rich repeat region (6 copies)
MNCAGCIPLGQSFLDSRRDELVRRLHIVSCDKQISKCEPTVFTRANHAFGAKVTHSSPPTLVKTPENRIGMANAHLTANERTFALQWKLQNEKFAMTKFALLLLTTLLPGGAIAQFSYTVSNNTVTITAYTGPGGAVVIPSTIIGLPVVSIGASAFANHPGLTSIMIPQSVSSIGLTPFSGSSGLTAITVDAGNLSYSSVDGVLFNKNQTVLVVFPSGRGGSYVLPNSVTNIGEFAFYSCLGLTNITIDAGVQFISRWGFSGIGNTNLTALYFEGNAPIPLPAAFQAFKALLSAWNDRLVGDICWLSDGIVEAIDSDFRTELWGADQQLRIHCFLGPKHSRRRGSLHKPGQPGLVFGSNSHSRWPLGLF